MFLPHTLYLTAYDSRLLCVLSSLCWARHMQRKSCLPGEVYLERKCSALKVLDYSLQLRMKLMTGVCMPDGFCRSLLVSLYSKIDQSSTAAHH